MCGITGYWVRDCQSDAWLRDLPGAVQSLRQRGPDDSGTWVRTGGGVAFGHTRLSILDLSELGRQPMVSDDGDLVMVFNGEIYNFAEIRAELEKRGHHFRSSGDSEVVLAALRHWGIAAVERFIGMFAIALWRESERRLVADPGPARRQTAVLRLGRPGTVVRLGAEGVARFPRVARRSRPRRAR